MRPLTPIVFASVQWSAASTPRATGPQFTCCEVHLPQSVANDNKSANNEHGRSRVSLMMSVAHNRFEL